MAKLETRGRRRRAHVLPMAMSAEVVEQRVLLSTGPQLIQVVPNTGAAINLGGTTIENQAPTQLTMTFSAGLAVDSSTLGAITVTRSGGDGIFQNGNDQAVAAGSIQVDPQNLNQVIFRFANTPVNDTYRIHITGALNIGGQAFNGGQEQFVKFGVDSGAQVVSVVPQPVLRTAVLTIGDATKIIDGDTFTLAVGGAPVTFQFKDSTTGSVVPPSRVAIVYNPGDSASTLATDVATAVTTQVGNNLSPLFGALTATPAAGTVSLVGTAFSPVVSPISATYLNIVNATKITDGDIFTVTSGPTTVTYQFKDVTTASIVPPTNVEIDYNPGDTAAALAADIRAAINSSSFASPITATLNGPGIRLTGSPSIVVSTAQVGFLSTVQGFMSVADGALTQATDKVIVYFSQDPLNAALASNPAFYQVINTLNGSILQPNSVIYSGVNNTAILSFAAPLPTGTFHLQIGAPLVNGGTLATHSVQLGTLFSNTGDYNQAGFIGDLASSSTNPNAFNLYQMQTSTAGENLTITASNLAASLGANVVIRVFLDTGSNTFTEVGAAVTGLTRTVALLANSTYYIGISSAGNSAYTPTTPGSGASGTGFGSYQLLVHVDNSFSPAADTSSFGTSANLGTLAGNGFTIGGSINTVGGLLLPQMPGTIDTPGNRNVAQDGVGGESIGDVSSAPPSGATPAKQFDYNFKDIYGSFNGQQLHNGITENQKQDAREIFALYAQYLGVNFRETDASGLTIVTGDIRALAPADPPDNVGGIAGGSTAIINERFNYGSSPYGGSWFGVAFHEIGHLLGLSHSFDVPSIMGSGLGSTPTTTNQDNPPGTEPSFPGDIDLVQGLLHNPSQSNQVNLYKFTLTQAGTFSAETIAQRTSPTPSLLDTVITLYSEATAQASASTDFNTGVGGVVVTFNALSTTLPGIHGNGITLKITKSDLGAVSNAPTVSVNGTTISITLNTHIGFQTTAAALQTAIANDVLAQNMLSVSITGPGGPATNIATPASTTTNLTTAGGQGDRTIIARNDDYFGRDSFVSLHLAAGNYYVAVTSIGNTSFDPNIADSGFGGRTRGSYQLKVNFNADPVAPNALTLDDAGGVALDGDGQYQPGGTFNFWFQSGNTIFVDKNNAATLGQNGTLANPYGDIASALQAASNASAPGVVTLVRIVGNGGSDGNPNTLGDENPYLVGFDSQGNPEADGSTFLVPGNVTVVIDAGAMVKLHSAIIDVGHKVEGGIDDSGAALQVLGTPGDSVVFTSLFNNADGGNSDTLNSNGVNAGDWGGLVFRQTSDKQAKDSQGKGIFLNSVNQSNITYGGGTVDDDSVPTVFDPIYITNPSPTAPFIARPAVWFNTFTLNADHAISADPNSFFNSEDRIGPDVYGNLLYNNSLNGFFIRVTSTAGQPPEQLGLSARINHTDITYVLSDNLLIDGNPTGPSFIGGVSQTNLAGSFVLDPGTILKLTNASIEMQIGSSQFIAEGTASNPVIFTSINDNSFGADGIGAGGTGLTADFDKNGTFAVGNNPNAVANAGDWGGLFFNSVSKGSIDHAIIEFAGGQAQIGGISDSFNPIEIQQATVRVANTLFQNNADGHANQIDDDGAFGNRDGLQGNSAATIFVRGAQPVIIDNTFIDNGGAMISVNANALNNLIVPDWGRSTDTLDAFAGYGANYGPLVALNRGAGNGINGMEVRGEEITTQTIWDDTDIVHVVRTGIFDDIDQHTFGGIRLESNDAGSLVVKLFGNGASFNIDGMPHDMADRIGGTFQVVGTTNHPVILTSLFDDSVGAGFRPDNQPQLDTNGDGNATNPAAGQWGGITLGQYSNDRNVAVVNEGEGGAALTDQDGTSGTAQVLGLLAPNLNGDTQFNPNGGNDYQALGFDVHGSIRQPSDVDVYSFTATAGTEVWFDIGMTSSSLSTVLELVDSTGKVLARSDGATGSNVLTSFAVTALSMLKDPGLGQDFYSTNPRDAGMRVILPGAAGTSGSYFIRVRSSGGLTQGDYELQVRLRQQWETAGSTVQYSNISYATTGITVQGLPDHSPLTADAAANGSNTTNGGNGGTNVAQELGNLQTTDQTSISVAGNLGSATQIDWYKFELGYSLLEAIAGVNGAGKTFSTIFDIDYADGLSRADTTLSVFDSTGTLILVSRDGGVTNDVSGPNEGNGFTDLSRGSIGKLDPFIGSQQLPSGTGGGTFTYYVAVSSNLMLPTALNATFNGGNTNDTLVRLEPVTSVRRVVEDHIGFTGYTTGSIFQGVTSTVLPTTSAILPINTTAQVATNVQAWNLSDVTLYAKIGNSIVVVDPNSGQSLFTLTNNLPGNGTGSIKMRPDGTLWAYVGQNGGRNGFVGQLFQIDTSTGAASSLGTDAIPDEPQTPPPTSVNQNTSDTVDSFVWVPDSSQPGGYALYYAVRYRATGLDALYKANPTSGVTGVDNNQYSILGLGAIVGATGRITGMESVGGTLFAVTSDAHLLTLSLGTGAVTSDVNMSGATGGAGFTGLTLGPQNLNGGVMKNWLFASTTTGAMLAFNISGTLQTPFALGTASTQAISLPASGGLAFSPLDFNLWHPTFQQNTTAGHGIVAAPDNSRNLPGSFDVTVGSTADSFGLNEGTGGASYYFGLENWSNPQTTNTYIAYTQPSGFVNGQFGVMASSNFAGNNGIANSHQALTTLDSSSLVFNPNIGNNYNTPGGAHGTLVTNTFSLATYSTNDAPTLYFNYMLGTEDANSGATMRDAARVFVSIDGGTTWVQVATNNGVLSTPVAPVELPIYKTPSINAFPPGAPGSYDQAVQELYDTNNWRQARIDLSQFVGNANMKLRFDFNTSGATQKENAGNTGLQTQPQPGDATGVTFGDKRTTQNNNFVGWYIDDIVVGFANRGEMVTGANNSGAAGDTSFFQLPQNPLAGGGQQSFTGPYQLEIRRGQTYGVTVNTVASNIIYSQASQFDANARMMEGFTLAAPVGVAGLDGTTFQISDGVTTLTFEFDNNASFTPANQQIVFSTGDSSIVMAQRIRNAINAANTAKKFKVTANLADGLLTGQSPLYGSIETNPNVDLNNAESVNTGSAGGFGLTSTYYNRHGDQNTIRQQGHLQISNNSIMNSSNWGIDVQPGPKDAATNESGYGSVRNLPTLNNNAQVPGIDIVNNIIADFDFNFSTGGIRFAGDVGIPSASAPVGRIINNTISGNAFFPFGTGIQVLNNAAPTLMNNIIANEGTAISIDQSSFAGTVVTSEVFQNNNNLPILGTNPIALQANEALFVDPFSSDASGRGFYLAERLPAQLLSAIDSATSSQPERAVMNAVLSAIGLPPSPIITPDNDRFGQVRVDDSNVANTGGPGQKIFTDRGAIERADFVGPTGKLVQPLDNGAGDGDPTQSNVLLTTATPLTVFGIQFTDSGIGIDDSSAAVSANYVLKQGNAPPLVDGVDYNFIYNANTHTAQFQSTSVFDPTKTYTITVNRQNIFDFAGNILQPNQVNQTEVFTIVGNVPPTLTTVPALPGVKDFTENVTYSVNGITGVASLTTTVPTGTSTTDLTVLSGHTADMLITSIGPGTDTLQIKKFSNSLTFTVVAGLTVSANNSNLLENGDILIYKPAIGQTGSLTAFSVVGYDPQNAIIAPQLSQSSPAVPVKFNVIDPTPTIAAGADLSLATLGPTPFPITFATLAANLSAQWFEGTGAQQELEITPIPANGTLYKNSQIPANLITVPTLIKAGDTLIWVPNAAPYGAPLTTTPVTAFTVRAHDAFNAINFPTFQFSTSSQNAVVDVLNASAPAITNTSITLGPKPRFVANTISFTDIQTASGTVIGTPGDTLKFRIVSIAPGTSLTFTHLGVTNTAVAGTVLVAGDTLSCLIPGGTGVTNAFTVTPFEITPASLDLESFTNILVKLNLINLPPTLSAVNTLGIADQVTPFNVTYAVLLGSSNAVDPNGDTIKFAFTAVQNGTLTVTHLGVTSTVVLNSTLFVPGDTLTWTPAAGVVGNLVNAFKVMAFDGQFTSGVVQVNVNVRPLGTAFSLTDAWLVQNSSGTTLGLGRVSQSGANLTFVNYNGVGSTGAYTTVKTVTANKFDGQPTVTGSIDISAPDQGRILWADGNVWIRVGLGGQWAVKNPGSNTSVLGSIVQNGVLVNMVGGGVSTTATLAFNKNAASFVQLNVQGPNKSVTAINLTNNIFTLPNGQVWVKLDLPNTYNSSLGGPTQVIQNGTTTLTFVNRLGQTSTGAWTDTHHVTAFGGLIGTVGGGKITWSNGETWNQNFLIFGTKNGTGTTTIGATPNGITITDANGAISHIQLLNFNTVVGLDGPMAGLTASRFQGKLKWSNGAIWDSFDLNALNAIFEMATGYPI